MIIVEITTITRKAIVTSIEATTNVLAETFIITNNRRIKIAIVVKTTKTPVITKATIEVATIVETTTITIEVITTNHKLNFYFTLQR